MNLKKNVKTYLYVKKSQLFEKNTIFLIAMVKSTQNRKLTLKMCFWGSSATSILNFIFFFKCNWHVIFRLGFARVHNDFFTFSSHTEYVKRESIVFIIKTDAKLCQKLETLLLHDFVSKARSQYYKILKYEMKPGEFLVTADFAENCAFVVQEAAQAFHWNNNQAKLECCSFVGISDCSKHDTIAVHMFQEVLIKYLI